jgi:hypothetical protein
MEISYVSRIRSEDGDCCRRECEWHKLSTYPLLPLQIPQSIDRLVMLTLLGRGLADDVWRGHFAGNVVTD